MAPQPETWHTASWSRVESTPTTDLPPSTRAALSSEVAALPDDQPVTIRAGVLRALLALADPPRTPGAAVTDPDRRVTYLTTVTVDQGRARLRTVEVVPHDDNPDPAVFRVPTATVALHAASVVAAQAATADETGGDPADVVVWGPADGSGGPPSPETLLELLQRFVTRQEIADLYGRSLSRVDQWLRAARRQRPDLPWPPPLRGPKPRQPDPSRGPSIREAAWQRARAQADPQTPADDPSADRREGER